MKKVLFLWLAVLLMLPSVMRAQSTTLTVADGTDRNNYLPIYGLYLDYTGHNQVIYPESMLVDMLGATISSITFYMETVPTTPWAHTFQFGLGTTTTSNFSDENLITTGISTVYTGTISVNSQFTVTFTTPFVYNGGNLVLDVQNIAGGYSGGYFYGTNTSQAAGIYSHVSSFGYETIHNQTFIPKTTFTYSGGATCLLPSSLQISGISANAATFSWTPRGTENSWDIYFTSDATDTPDATTTPTYTSTDTIYNFYGLTESTTYYVYVRANCGSGEYSTWNSTSFRTSQIPAQLPYFCNFEDPTESSQWSIEGSGVNQWVLGTAVNATNNGAYALYVSCDSGATNNYINNSSSLSWAYRDIDFGTTYAEFNLSFKVKIVGESESYDYLRVYLGSPAELPTSANYTGALPTNATFLGAFSGLSDWTEVSGIVNSDFQGIQRLYLLWWNDTSGGDNPAAAVDDLSIIGTTCGRPNNLTTDTNYISQTSIQFHFSPALASDNAWEAIILAPGDTIDESYIVSLSDTTHTFTDLEPNTLYRILVRTNCGVETSYWSEVLEVRTSCTQFMSIPFTEDFSGYGTGSAAFPQCWMRSWSTTYTYPYISSNSNGSLYFSSTIASSYVSAGNSRAILPEIDTITNPINSLSINFKIKRDLTSTGSGALQVGVLTDPNDFATFTVVQNYTGTEWAETNQWYEVEIPLTDYTGYGSYIAFRKVETSGNSTYIDDVEVYTTPNCLKPMGVAVSAITDNSVSVSWTARNEETSWEVAVIPAGSDVTEATPETVTSNPCTILNLVDNTEYDVYVKAVCGSGENSEWSLPVSFHTRCLPTNVIPFTENFEGMGSGENAFPSCWSRITNHTSTTYPYVDDSRASEGDASLYLYASTSTYSLAASQALDLSSFSANSLSVTFKAYKNNSSYGRIDVGFMTDPDNLNTFTAIKSIYPSDFTHNQWCQFDIPVTSAYQNGNVYLALYAPAGDNNYINIDEVELGYQPICSAPSNLIVSNVAGTSALLSWDAAIYGNTDYSVEYSEAGMNSWNIAEASVIGTSYLLSGLNSQTAYDIRVSSNCATDDSTFATTSFLTLCLSPGAEVTIGNGDTESQYLPSSTNWGYSLTQQLFNATEVGAATTLTGIKFEITDATPQDRNWDIYLGNTSQADLTTSTYISTSNQSLVFSGVVSMEEEGWIEINFSTPFTYTGENLVLTIDDNTDSYNGVSYFASHSGNSLYKRSDSENFNPVSATSFSSNSSRNNVIFMGECDSVVTCVVPNMIVTDITSQSITVNWAPGYQETSWELEYKGASDASWTSIGSISAYPYTFDNLAENNEYQIRLRSECGGSYSDWAIISAQTECVGITELPYVQNFDAVEGSSNTSLDCWFTGTNNSTPYPHIDDAQSHSPNSSLYFYASSSSYSYATTPRFSQSIDMSNLQISFYARKSSANYMIEVGIMTNPNDYSTFELIGAVSPQDINLWSLCEINTDSYTGDGRYVAFRVPQWFSNTIIIDDVDIHEIPFCGRVEDIVANPITSSSATITWTPGGDESSWEVLYAPAGTIDYNNTIPELVVGTPSIQLSNLLSSTGYDVAVRALCSNNELSAWTTASFRTDCGMITELPYTESFETFETGSSGQVFCWTKLSTSSSYYPYISSSNAVSGSKSLFFNSSNSNYSFIATPQLDPSISVSNLEVTLQMSSTNTLMKLIVGVLPNIADASSFVPVDTLEVAAANQWTFFNIPFNTYTGIGSHIAFKNLNLSTSSYSTYSLYVDDIQIAYLPTCARPTNVTAVSTLSDIVTVSWTDTEASTWDIIYGPTGFDPETSNEATLISGVTTTTYNVTGLSAGTIYDFYVRAVCSTNDNSPWSFDPATGAPYTYVMNTASDTITACGITVVDNGGFADDYLHNSDNILVIYPEQADSLLTISGTFIGESSVDYLSIYKGVGVNTENLLQKVVSGTSGNLINFGPLVSEFGPLTLHFHSDFSNAYQGFAATINCVGAPTCRRAYNLNTISVTSNTANIGWSTIDNNFAGFNIAVATQDNFNPDTCTNIFTSTSTNVQITGLNANTVYYVKVQASCGGDDISQWSDVHSFMTSGNTAQIPYFSDFASDSEVADWLFFNGTQTNKWYIGTPSGMTSPKLYISNNNGVTNAYTTSSATSNVWACRDIEFTGNYGEYQLSFNWKAQGESTYDYMRVYIGNPTTPENSVTAPAGVVQISPDYLNLDSTTFRFSFDASYANTVKRLYFFWHNDGSGGTNPPASIDSIQIVGISCAKPYNVQADNITQTTAVITFSPAMASDNTWEYVYGPANSDPSTLSPTPITDTMINLTGLAHSTFYDLYVRTVCDAGEYSDWSNVCSFFTLCDAISTLPYTETFDSYGVGTSIFPQCWFKQSTANNYPSISSTNYTGPGSLYFYASSGNYNIAATPEINTDVLTLSTLEVNFWYRPSNATSNLVVGVMTDPTDATTFVAIDTVTGPASTWSEHTIYLAAYTGAGRHVAFKSEYNTAINYGYLDNVTIDVAPTCLPVMGISASNIDENSATISWTDLNNATSWNIEYGIEGFELGQGTAVTDITNPYTITGLNSNTIYEVYVQSNCDAAETSDWTGPFAFRTACGIINNLPYTEDFDSYTAGSTMTSNPSNYPNDELPSCWSFLNRSTVSGNYPAVFLSSYSSYAVLGNCLFFKSSNTTPLYAILPDFAANIQDLKVTFSYRNEGVSTYNGTLSVGYMTDLNDATTFTEISTCIQNSAMIENTVLFNTVPTSVTDAYIVFKYTGGTNSNYYLSIDNVVVDYAQPVVTCDAPTNVQVTPTANTANVTWTSTADAWVVEYKEATAANWTASATLTANNYNITGLTATTDYVVRVKAICDTDTESDWSAEVPFTTLAGEVTTYTITATATGPGTITPNGTVTVTEGENANFTFAADAGAVVDRLLVDDVETTIPANNEYTFSNVVANHTIAVEFVEETGIEEIDLNAAVVLYPNPATSQIQIQVADSRFLGAEMQIFDVYGKLISNATIETLSTQVDVSQLANGMYMVRINAAEGMVTKRFVKR